MEITCISDLHGHYPELPGGDLLIVAGDLTATDTIEEHSQFTRWLRDQNYKKKVFIGGNHDTALKGPWPGGTKGPFREDKAFYDFDYLCDSGTEFEGLKVWGSPWTVTFPGMNPRCKAFTTNSDDHLHAIWIETIPNDIDILITHSPPYGILDEVRKYGPFSHEREEHVGSESLRNIVLDGNTMTKLKLHCFGHIHEQGGRVYETSLTKFVNASHVNERYEPVNKPIRVIL